MEELRLYALDPNRRALSEHVHLGPYMNLELMTWHEAKITDHSIVGTVDDFVKLADLIERKLKQSKPGEAVVIDGEYSPYNEAVLEISIRDPGFDPSTCDPFVHE